MKMSDASETIKNMLDTSGTIIKLSNESGTIIMEVQWDQDDVEVSQVK